ncbi:MULTISPECIES: hypothetical protein [Cyanophyceae]|uniref:hypothetical protein n=1 Tax=Cyanophyceae TaxID=3028117 RepID=UPI00168266A5|nr:hypothetical protein [Trichocoleus sp. FACHB-40]MBD2006341.1 hypothetical protein [Trichocoleus sp. FACHB-40]
MNDNFLPNSYEPPKAASGLFFKLLGGENRIRILDKPEMGYQYWNENNKCVYLRERPAVPPTNIRKKGGVPEKIKHFWAMPIWNYGTEQICIWEVTQSTIQSAIMALSRSEDWGSPIGYDLKIIKTGEKLETEYNVIPVPPKLLSKEIEEAWKKSKVKVSTLFAPTEVEWEEDYQAEDEELNYQEIFPQPPSPRTAAAPPLVSYSAPSPRRSHPAQLTRDRLMEISLQECKRVGLTSRADGSRYLQSKYKKNTRQELSDEELLEFVGFLQSQPSAVR